MIYQEGTAIGMSLVHRNADKEAKVLMGIKLNRVYPCAKYFKEDRIRIDGRKQICFGGYRKSRPVRIFYCDSGGPIINYDYMIDALCFIGISSFSSISCTDPLIPSVFARVDSFFQWIEQAIDFLSVGSEKPCSTIM